MYKQRILATVVSGALMMISGAPQAVAASTGFDSFTALPGSVPGGSLAESSPLLLANPSWSQTSVANRANQLSQGIDNSGNWDMITANESGADEVYSFNLASNNASLFVNTATLDQATGLSVGSVFKNPDNLAIDAKGNIYIVEDQPGGSADIWFAQDANNDGIAESVGRWASLSTSGAEPTGLYFDKFNPNIAYVNVQHPFSGDDRTVMIAVPEPQSYAMLMVGLGLVGASVYRRKRPHKAIRK